MASPWIRMTALVSLLACFVHSAYAVVKGSDATKGITIPRNKFLVPVVCYYYGWAIGRPPPMNYKVEDVPLDYCTFVVLAFAGIDDSTWELKSVIPEYQQDESLYRNFTDLKTQHLFLKTMLAVGGWDHGGKVFSDMVSKPERRTKFVKSALDWMLGHGFDGLEIIWKYPGYEPRGGTSDDKDNFVQLLKELKEAFNPHPLFLTAAVPIEEHYLEDGYDIPRMTRATYVYSPTPYSRGRGRDNRSHGTCRNVDWFNVLAYDLRGKWNRFTDMHSILYKRAADSKYFQELTIAEGMKRLVSMGAPKEKLMLGMAFYGRTYVLRDPAKHGVKARIKHNQPAEAGPYVRSHDLMGYYEICPNIKSGLWTREFDQEAKCPYAYHGDQWVGYEDEESVANKMDFIIGQGYRGVMVFNNDLDDFRGVCGPKNPLMKVIFNKVGEKELRALNINPT